jgi:hypothetical protein
MVAWTTDPFFSAKLRIECATGKADSKFVAFPFGKTATDLDISRANEHLDVLSRDFDRFFSENPGEYVAEPDTDGVHTVYKIKFRERFPMKWRVIAAEMHDGKIIFEKSSNLRRDRILR